MPPGSRIRWTQPDRRTVSPTLDLFSSAQVDELLAVIEQHDALRLRFNNVAGQWQAGVADNYRAKLEAESAENGLRKMLFGMGSLSLGELAGERMKVALEANSTEDEHDCFSDNTHNSHFYNAKGIRNIYLGEYQRVDGSTLKGASLASLVEAVNPQADSTLKTDLETTEALMEVVYATFGQS